MMGTVSDLSLSAHGVLHTVAVSSQKVRACPVCYPIPRTHLAQNLELRYMFITCSWRVAPRKKKCSHGGYCWRSGYWALIFVSFLLGYNRAGRAGDFSLLR